MHTRYKARQRHGRLKADLNLKLICVCRVLCAKVVGATSSECLLDVGLPVGVDV